MKKIKSTFVFTQEYISSDKGRRKAEVKLEIDYNSKNYSILPKNTYTNFFEFRQNSKENKMWKAVVSCIDQAIDFAEKELAYPTEPKEKDLIYGGYIADFYQDAVEFMLYEQCLQAVKTDLSLIDKTLFPNGFSVERYNELKKKYGK